MSTCPLRAVLCILDGITYGNISILNELQFCPFFSNFYCLFFILWILFYFINTIFWYLRYLCTIIKMIFKYKFQRITMDFKEFVKLFAAERLLLAIILMISICEVIGLFNYVVIYCLPQWYIYIVHLLFRLFLTIFYLFFTLVYSCLVCSIFF